jgi:hypothetical protein
MVINLLRTVAKDWLKDRFAQGHLLIQARRLRVALAGLQLPIPSDPVKSLVRLRD